MLNLTTWIQNPDKSQRDFILIDGEFIPTHNLASRSEASEKIFDIESAGGEFYRKNGLRIVRYKSSYLVKLQTSKLDNSGRSMPIIMLVENYGEESDSQLRSVIMKTLEKSKYEIKEDCINQILSQINQNLLNLKKKR